ncbi:MAG: Gfo/Idh/MocA family oxidoreductase [Haloferacaceae archaeon]
MTYDVAIVGTGPDPEEKGRDGYAMAYRHAPGYERLDSCSLVACADIVEENARAFADRFGLDQVYGDYETMLREVEPDVVSVCVPPNVHAEIVLDCARASSVSAIHCEKPMATTWGDCRSMVSTCEENDVQLTIDHQRRFAAPVRKAKGLLESGEIGELRRLEWSEVNLFDAGSHLFDLCTYFTDAADVEWVLAGIDCAEENRWFGSLNETRAIAQWKYQDGTVGFASTAEDEEATLVDAYLRLVGTEGTIEIQASDGSPLRMRTDDGWESVDTGGETVYSPSKGAIRLVTNKLARVLPRVPDDLGSVPSHYHRAIEHAVDCLEEGTEPIISGRNVLGGTELIFAAWESVRRRGQVSLPLEVSDNPLVSMYEAGLLGETPEDHAAVPAPGGE